VIAFSDIARYFLNLAPGDGDFDHIPALVWGSFDGTDSPPIVYPQTPQPNQTPAMSLRDLRNYFLGRNP
jgi:hypothetical protein